MDDVLYFFDEAELYTETPNYLCKTRIYISIALTYLVSVYLADAQTSKGLLYTYYFNKREITKDSVAQPFKKGNQKESK